jgi:hypothetical protein
MKSIDFPGATLKIGKNQTDVYNVLHAMPVPGPEGEIIVCFELSEEELKTIIETRKIYYSRLTFGNNCMVCGQFHGFAPMKIFTSLDEGLELKMEENKS